MNRGDEITLWQMKSMMNDYRQITAKTNGNYFRLQPERTMADHHATMEYFRTFLANRTSTGPVVVVTHHAPSKMSTKPRYQNDTIMNGAYSSDLSEFILDHPEIRVWTHGHTHDPFDYIIGTTRVICNPRGYKGYESRAEEFDPALGFEI
jgi:activator of HSP90 ATPase